MIFSLLIIHNHDSLRMPINRLLHTTTWDFFTSQLPVHLSPSPKVVKNAIMTDINDLVQGSKLKRTLREGTVGGSVFEMRRLLKILQKCFDTIEVSFVIISVFMSCRLSL